MTDPNRPTALTCDDVRDLAGSFVLGALPAAEADAVRAHLTSCPEAHAEVAELASVVPVLDLDAAAAGLEPSTGLKDRILAAAAAEPNAVVAPAAPAAPAVAAPIPFPTVDERAERTAARPRTSPLAWAFRIAAVVAIVALVGWNLLLQGQLTESQQYQASVSAVLQAAQQPGAVAAILAPDGGAGSGIAAITATGDITLAMHDLAPTAGAQVYEAWVIGSDGAPIPIGSFQVGRGGTGSLDAESVPASAGLVVALTLEPGAGATTPTLPIVSKGVATAAG
jgi:anti-sigma factor RsiW